MSLLPRTPTRRREIRCYPDCTAQETGDPADCHCAERDDAAYSDACEQAYDEWKDNGGSR